MLKRLQEVNWMEEAISEPVPSNEPEQRAGNRNAMIWFPMKVHSKAAFEKCSVWVAHPAKWAVPSSFS